MYCTARTHAGTHALIGTVFLLAKWRTPFGRSAASVPAVQSGYQLAVSLVPYSLGEEDLARPTPTIRQEEEEKVSHPR